MQMKDKFKTLIKDTLIFAIGNLGSKLILFFLVPLYTNALSTSEYGTADLVYTVSQFLVPFFSVVIFDAVIRFGLSKFEKSNEVLLCGLLVWLLGTIGIVIITPLFRYYATVSDWKWFLCIYSSATILWQILMNYVKCIGRNKTYAIISIIQTALLAGLNILLLLVFKIGVKGYLLSNILSLLITCILIILITNILPTLKYTKLNKRLLKEMVWYSSPLIFNNVSWWIIHSTDKIMLEMMIGASALGIYTVATKIPSLINVMISIFSQSWGISSIKEIESSKDMTFYSEVLKTYTFLVFFACVTIIAIIKPFMTIYVGREFVDSWHYVAILLVSAVYSAIASYYGSIYSALKKSLRNMSTTVSGAIINIIVNFFCIKTMGIIGAAIGTAVAYMVIAIARMIDIRKMISIQQNWIRFIINSLIVILDAIFVSLDFHVGVVSITTIVFFTLINKDDILHLIKSIRVY